MKKKSVKKKPGQKKAGKKKTVKKARKKPAKKKSVKKKTGQKTDDLNIQQKKFAEIYITDREFFGNGLQSYAVAYNIDLKKKNGWIVAAAAACRLLKNVKVLAYINTLLEDMALNDAHVDKQLAFLIIQNAELGTKLGAIREYNALRNRIKNKMEHTIRTVTFKETYDDEG